MNNKDLLNYYNKKKPIGVIFMLIVVVLLYSPITSIDSSFGWPLIFMILYGAYSLYRFFKFQTDQAIDDYCGELAEEYHKEQRKVIDSYKIEIEEEILYSGYLFENIFSARTARTGRDGIVRSSIAEMACVYISDEMIYVYNKRCSLISEEKSQNQREFCVSDIQMSAIEELDKASAVALTLTGGEKIYLKCNSREQAIRIFDRIKNKMQG